MDHSKFMPNRKQAIKDLYKLTELIVPIVSGKQSLTDEIRSHIAEFCYDQFNRKYSSVDGLTTRDLAKKIKNRFQSSLKKTGKKGENGAIRFDLEEKAVFERNSAEIKKTDDMSDDAVLSDALHSMYLASLFEMIRSNHPEKKEVEQYFWAECHSEGTGLKNIYLLLPSRIRSVEAEVHLFIKDRNIFDILKTDLSTHRDVLQDKVIRVLLDSDNSIYLEGADINDVVWKIYLEQFAVLQFRLSFQEKVEEIKKERLNILNSLVYLQCSHYISRYNIANPSLLATKIDSYCEIKNYALAMKSIAPIWNSEIFIEKEFIKLYINKKKEDFDLYVLLGKFLSRHIGLNGTTKFHRGNAPSTIISFEGSEFDTEDGENANYLEKGLESEDTKKLRYTKNSEDTIKLYERAQTAMYEVFYGINYDPELPNQTKFGVFENRHEFLMFGKDHENKSYTTIYADLVGLNISLEKYAAVIAEIPKRVDNQSFIAGQFIEGSKDRFHGNIDSFKTTKSRHFAKFLNELKFKLAEKSHKKLNKQIR
ncbi:hypothetical protein [Dyadobacter frigoris]|uniref:Uncharacterized protein n=1 Tax=Dyadobacter frigoris TaxID=2576211 RepID=A0A4U6CLU2_9BACT|nr:hypothetical protein [Dyadobacter frigoris]TKT85262.1 hypothetical protein FDK13_34280 [Dyadobacter frigoris]